MAEEATTQATKLKSATGLTVSAVSFDEMLSSGFGIVTVMNARVFKQPIETVLGTGSGSSLVKADLKEMKVHDIVKNLLRR